MFPLLNIAFLLVYFVCLHVYGHACGGQRTTYGSWFSPSAIWVLGLGSGGQAWQQGPAPAECLTSLVSRFSTDTEKYFSCLMKGVQPLKPFLTPENYQRRNHYLANFCCCEGQLSPLEPAWQFVENAGLLCKNLI